MTFAPQNIERPAPNAYEAEQALLGSILIDPSVMSDLEEYRLEPDMFYQYQNRQIFEAILGLIGEGIEVDFITLSGKLPDEGSEAYLIDLINVVPTSVNAGAYARAVASAWWRRRVIAFASMVANLAYSDGGDDEVMRNIDAAYYHLDQPTGDKTLKSMEEIVADHLAEVESRDEDWVPGVPTGITGVDDLLGGFKSKFIIVAGRPGMGKTAFCDTASVFQASRGYRVGWIDLESGHEGKLVRMAANVSHMNTRVIEEMTPSSPAYHEYLIAAGEVSKLPIFVDSLSELNLMTLRRRITYMVRALGVQIVYIDHLQLMDGDDKQTRERQLSAISRGLKGLTHPKELNIPIVALTQLNRNVEHRADKRPLKSDLSGSGSLEQDADIIMLLYRDDYYNPQTTERPNVIEINVDKHRNGPSGMVDAYWDAQSARVCNLKQIEFALPKLTGASINY